ncbi:MAG: tetratricopeptide repeat protein [Bacteroidales bacterium]|nr:tetratricopeptide repeat protein [Bacteroidales bacterium]
MKRIITCLLALLLIFGYSCKNKNRYADMPKELAELCKNIDRHPKRAELYYQRADYYYYHHNVDKGIADMQTAIRLQPDSSKYYVKLSDLYFAQRETDLAEEMLQTAINKDPDNNEARLKLAELYFHLRMMEQCGATVDEAVQRQSFNPKAYLIKAFMLKEQRDTADYLRTLQLVIDQDPKETKAFLELGYFYQQRNNPLAISYYQNGLAADPNNVEIRYNLGKMYQDMGQLENAEQEYKTVIEIDPKNIPALNNLGYIYLDDSLARYNEAAKLFTRAIEANPNFVYSVCNRGVAYEYLGQYDKARRDYQAALKLETNFEPAIAGLNRLDKLQSR